MNLLILGGGLAGLSAAWHARGKADYVLYEKELSVGGLCRSFYLDGFTFDFSGHLLHLRDPYFQQFVKDLIGNRLITKERDAWIFSKEVYTHYPFQENTYGLPPEVIKECVEGFQDALKKRANTEEKEPENFYEWIIYQFGEGIARHFMVPYNEKMFTVHPKEMTTSWLGRFVPRPSLERVIAGSKSDLSSNAGYNASFFYPRKGGIGVLPGSLLSELSSVKLGQAAIRIDTEEKKVYFSQGETAKYDKLLSTIPLPELLKLIDKLPQEVKNASERLRHNSVLCLNLGVGREKISDTHWIYFPEAKYCFYRVGFYSNINPLSAPPHTSSLYAEVAYSKEKPLDKSIIEEEIIADLKSTGILQDNDRILVRQALDIEYAYIFDDFNRESTLQTIVEYLKNNDIQLAGRYGEWAYMAMEDALISGKKAVEGILCGG